MDIPAENIDVIKTEEENGNTTNPMLLSPIIKCIYQYLDLEDIKNCRLAAREWSLNSTLILRGRSKIVLTSWKQNGSSLAISKFLEDFSDTPNNFNAFKLSNGLEDYDALKARWEVNELNKFFESQQGNMKELELDGIYLRDDNQIIDYSTKNVIEVNGMSFYDDLFNDDYMVNKYDITPWISGSLMTKANTKYNTKLSVRSRYHNLSISLSALVAIKDISLNEVLINVDNVEGGLKMSPIKLNLDDVAFNLGKIKFDGIRINDVVDFHKCKDVNLKGGAGNDSGTKITLDLGGNVYLDRLVLSCNLTLINWALSSWKVEVLKMVSIPYLKRSAMEILKLDVGYAEIDLPCLPQSIELLILDYTQGQLVRSSQPISFPNLKCLYLHIYLSSAGSHLSHFKNCPNLVDIHVNGSSSDIVIIKFDWIPKSVRRLKLISLDMVWEDVGDEPLILDQLVFSGMSYDMIKSIYIDNIQVKDIVVTYSFTFGGGHQINQDFFDLLKYFKQTPHRQAQRIFAGPFYWSEESYSLQNYVDKVAEYYVFENEIGRAIENKEFDDMGPTYLLL